MTGINMLFRNELDGDFCRSNIYYGEFCFKPFFEYRNTQSCFQH